MLTLNGLRIAAVGEGEAVPCNKLDVVWQARRVDALRGGMFDNVVAPFVVGDADLNTHHVFGFDGIARFHFRVSADGRNVESAAIPIVEDADSMSVFCEPVMRTVLSRLGLASFHGSALVKNDCAILLIGQKGAGKSALSAALQRIGWLLLADDLIRVSEVDGAWHAYAGHRQAKLRPDILELLGYRVADLAGRWIEPGLPSALRHEKYVLRQPEAALPPSASYFITNIIQMMPRKADLDLPDLSAASVSEAIHSLFNNTTPDPLRLNTARPACEQAVGGLLRQARIWKLTMPDRLGALQRSAEVVERALADSICSSR